MTAHIFKKGDEVILGEHQPAGPNQSKNWSHAMLPYVGTKVILNRTAGSDGAGCVTWYVTPDNGFFWREINMTLVNTLVGAKQARTTELDQKSGCKCTRCGEFYEYANPVPDFKCWGCRH